MLSSSADPHIPAARQGDKTAGPPAGAAEPLLNVTLPASDGLSFTEIESTSIIEEPDLSGTVEIVPKAKARVIKAETPRLSRPSSLAGRLARQLAVSASCFPTRVLARFDPMADIASEPVGFLRYFETDDISGAVSGIRRNRELFDNDRVASALCSRISSIIESGRLLDGARLRSLYRVPDNLVLDAFADTMMVGVTGQVIKALEYMNLSEMDLRIHLGRRILDHLSRGEAQNVNSLLFSVEEAHLGAVPLTCESVISALVLGSMLARKPVTSLIAESSLPERLCIALDLPLSDQRLGSVAANFGLRDINDFEQFRNSHSDYAYYVATTELAPRLAPSSSTAAKSLHITDIEAEELLQHDVDLETLKERRDWKALYLALRSHSADWSDRSNLQIPFEQGAKIFGLERMFEYASRPAIRRHDLIFAFTRVCVMQSVSALPPDQFFERILRQVARDDSAYPAGSSAHYLNQIADQIAFPISDTLRRAAECEEVPEIAELSRTFTSEEQVFTSWRELKRFFELQKLLDQNKILIDLAQVKRASGEEMYRFLVTLAFRPESNVRTESVLEFWRNPEAFFAKTDTTICKFLRPSNYAEIDHLDMTVQDLPLALATGALDRLQAFPPLEIEYRLPRESYRSTRELLNAAIGSRRAKIQGRARNCEKLFAEVQKVLREYGISAQQYLHGTVIPKEAEDKLFALCYDTEFGIEDTFDTVVAKVSLKSDADGIIAGNDTACCMAFGTGKNNIYMYNCNAALFTIQIKRENGTCRTIAQSLLTRDRDAGVSFTELASEFNPSSERFKRAWGKGSWRLEARGMLACDNVEIAPNYKAANWKRMIEAVYADFFSRYIHSFSDRLYVDEHSVVIGTGYSEALQRLSRTENTFVPMAPISYTDKRGRDVFLLELSDESIAGIAAEKETPSPPSCIQDEPGKADCVRPLHYYDTLAVADLERIAYKTNKELQEGVFDLENTLMAKDICNSHKGRPNLCFKHFGSDGMLDAYIIAYEGRYGAGKAEHAFALDIADQPIIYVADFARDPGRSDAATPCLQAFMNSYKEEYASKGRLYPIVADLRESTSLPLFKAAVKRMGRRLGLDFEIQEPEVYQAGTDRMHHVIAVPRLNTD